MSVLNQLASGLGRRDEVPNQLLAQKIADSGDADVIRELVDNLDNRNKNIQSDCIKVLYETGERRPELIAGYYRRFVELLDSNNNRLVWGAMTALDAITTAAPEAIHGMLPRILAAADSGSVITRDHAISILIKLAGLKKYAAACLPLLLEQLAGSPENQFPMYAENTWPVIDNRHQDRFQEILISRLEILGKESRKKRVIKILKKMDKNS